MKKLKQLATAYKKLEQEKADLDSKWKNSEKALEAARVEAAKPKQPQRAALPPQLIGRVQSMLSSSRSQIAELRSTVASDLKKQVPSLLEEALRAKLPELQRIISSSSSEWKEKYEVESARRRKLHNIVQELKGNIRVYCRVRPLNAHESGSCISFPSGDEIQTAFLKAARAFFTESQKHQTPANSACAAGTLAFVQEYNRDPSLGDHQAASYIAEIVTTGQGMDPICAATAQAYVESYLSLRSEKEAEVAAGIAYINALNKTPKNLQNNLSKSCYRAASNYIKEFNV